MAHRWQGRELVAALSVLIAGCDMTDGAANAAKAPPMAVSAIIDEFLHTRDSLAMLRNRRANLDLTFAANGSFTFDLAGVAAPGSQLTTGPDGDDLGVVIPDGTRLTLADVENRWGKARPIAATAGLAHRFTIDRLASVPGHTGRMVIELTARPASLTARVRRLTVMREPG